jgi:outer membrane protein OmpA-like peptidoglycan-associated protein
MRCAREPLARRAFLTRVGLVGGALALVGCQQGNPTMADRIAAMQTRGVILTVDFDLNSYAIKPQALPLLDEVAEALKDPKLLNFSFDVNGHTDVTGTLGRNLALSELRAAAITDHLAGRGVSRGALKPQGFGPLQLLVPAEPRSPRNRRVEIFAIPPGQAAPRP